MRASNSYELPYIHQVYCSRTIGCRRVGLIHRLRARLNARVQRRAWRKHFCGGAA